MQTAKSHFKMPQLLLVGCLCAAALTLPSQCSLAATPKKQKAMAASIADGVYGAGAHPHVTSARATHRSDIMTEVLDAGALLVGSCTLNNNIFPSIADLMTYMKGLRPRNLIGAAFGSYGWSGEAVKQLNAILEAMKVDVVHEGIRVKWVPTQEDLAQCRELGEMVGKMLVDTCDGA